MKIGFIGVGNMAGAILDGLLASNNNDNEFHIYNRTLSKLSKYVDTSVNIYNNPKEVIDKVDYLVLGYKPDGYISFLSEYDLDGVKLISIAAGMSTYKLSKYVTDFVITMPNTPSINKLGSTLMINSACIDDNTKEIFNSIGSVTIVEEDEFDKYMLVTGCAPAYFFSYIDLLSTSLSSKYNLDKTVVETLLVEVMNGSGSMFKTTNKDAHTLTSNVCSPGGVTIEVVKQLNEHMPQILDIAFDNALNRNNELK